MTRLPPESLLRHCHAVSTLPVARPSPVPLGNRRPFGTNRHRSVSSHRLGNPSGTTLKKGQPCRPGKTRMREAAVATTTLNSRRNVLWPADRRRGQCLARAARPSRRTRRHRARDGPVPFAAAVSTLWVAVAANDPHLSPRHRRRRLARVARPSRWTHRRRAQGELVPFATAVSALWPRVAAAANGPRPSPRRRRRRFLLDWTRPTWVAAPLCPRPTAGTRIGWRRTRRCAICPSRPRSRICPIRRPIAIWFRFWTIRPSLHTRTCTTRLRCVCKTKWRSWPS